MNITRVLVIDDSAFMRKMITDILSSHKQIQVVGTARNGQVALQKLKQLNPDVVTLDVEMPVMNGIETLEKLMQDYPVPVIMLSSETKEGASQTMQALALGAFDFVEKPSGQISLDISDVKEDLLNKVLAASKVNKKDNTAPTVEKVENNVPIKQMKNETVVAIGTSTGGPKALQEVLVSLPKNFQAPILIVQHMPPRFTKSLAERLDTLTEIKVKEATDGEVLNKGTAYIAPGDYHLEVIKRGGKPTIQLTKNPLISGHRPSVDVLFYSLTQLVDMNKIAVVLTGMGRDGSRGAKHLKKMDNQAIVLSESEESSVVFGMPAAVVKTGCVDKVVHLKQVSETLVHLTKTGGN